METIQKKFAFGSYLWLGLASYVFCVDVYALLRKRETLSEAFVRAINHPRRRWLVTASWIFTTKHLFFQKFMPWLDPFVLIAMFVKILEKLFGGNK